MPSAVRPNRQIIYAKHPTSQLTPDSFEMVDGTVGDPEPGEVLCRTILLSIDPANRAWMQGRTYRPQLSEGEVMAGFTLSEVIADNGGGIAPGSIVTGQAGWQEYAVLPARHVNIVNVRGPLTHHMSVLGITGLTAYFGLLRVGDPQPGQTVLVSAAAGATGNVVGQIAKLKGCRVVGITGHQHKGQLLEKELGFDAAVDYHSPTFADDLRSRCPDGVDVYFDNVGGAILEQALRLLNLKGRIVCCGAVSQYDSAKGENGVRGLPGLLITKRLRMEGFLVSDYAADWSDAEQELSDWVASGDIRVLEEVTDGLETAPSALVGLLAGANVGKSLVRVAPDPSSPA